MAAKFLGVIEISFAEKKKAILEGIVICGLVSTAIMCFWRGDNVNGAWALGLAGGYAFKNGVVSRGKSE